LDFRYVGISLRIIYDITFYSGKIVKIIFSRLPGMTAILDYGLSEFHLMYILT